ncbi:MAG: hypothetical protein ACKOUM_01425, partial [Sphingopyxis sp.]
MTGATAVPTENALVLCLPDVSDDAAPCPWWHVVDGAVVDRGGDAAALAGRAGYAAPPHIVGLAPAAQCSWHRATMPGLTEKQARRAAAFRIADALITPADDCHITLCDGQDGDERLVIV